MRNNPKRLASLILRGAVAFAFLYPAIGAIFDPFAWIGYFPPFLLDLFTGHEMLLLHVFGATEIVIALWLLSGWRIIIPAVIATIYLAAIVLLNFSQMDVVFRDVSIALAAVALAVLARRTRHERGHAAQ